MLGLHLKKAQKNGCTNHHKIKYYSVLSFIGQQYFFVNPKLFIYICTIIICRA